jgi:hypothetical protein
LTRVRGSLVVKALCHKPESREFETRSIKMIFVGSRAWPVRRADNLTSICEPIV